MDPTKKNYLESIDSVEGIFQEIADFTTTGKIATINPVNNINTWGSGGSSNIASGSSITSIGHISNLNETFHNIRYGDLIRIVLKTTTGGPQEINRIITNVEKANIRSGTGSPKDLTILTFDSFINTNPIAYMDEFVLSIIARSCTSNISTFSKKINCYSFALKPEEHQPSGSCNFSRIDSAKLKFSKAHDDTINVYAVNYNVLRIMSGMAGIAYSN